MIELKNICAGYDKRQVIANLSLQLPKGKLISVIGTNGSGKSTLLKVAIGILPLTSGEIMVDGNLIFAMSRQEIAKKIAYLAQGRNIPDMTVSQMVLHGRFPHLSYPRRYGKKDREIVAAAIQRMGIADFADRPAACLSGGMRQNAYIAMALAQDTDYILLDEPTTYLDIAGQLGLMKILRTLADSGKGIITVMHDLPLAFSCSDSIAVLKDGSIFICDTPENVCKSGVIKSVFGVELRYCSLENYYHYQYALHD